MTKRQARFFAVCAVFCSISSAQVIPAPAPPPTPVDTLGRESPRGAVLGFLNASSKGDFETARLYLNTTLRGDRARGLAQQLFEVLNRRLPARLNLVSARPEGSLYYPDNPDLDRVGTIERLQGAVDISMQRVDRGKNGVVWLFSRETLDNVPALYEEINLVSAEGILPKFLTEPKIAQIPLFHWLFAFVGMPLIYVLAGRLDGLASPFAGRLWRRLRRRQDVPKFRLLPQPFRLFLLVLVIRWMIVSLDLSLLTRQFWSGVASILTIASAVWLVLMLIAWGEDVARRRFGRRGANGAVSILRLVRRTFDLLAIFGGVLILLAHFNLNVTAALAGLGVGGIAIALAAQKTLENVIGGISIIADRVVRVGDFLKIGDTVGTVEDVGLRSTRIRTLERSVVSIPNGQISNERLEELSCRDKFWLHPVLSLRYETTADQLRAVLAAIRSLLLGHVRVEPDSVRVRFLRFGSSSLDIEVFAYISAIDFSGFLAVQEELLLRFMDAVQEAGTRMAFPSQTTYLAYDSPSEETNVRELLKTAARR